MGANIAWNLGADGPGQLKMIYNKFDFGLPAGGQVLLSGKIAVVARYFYGLHSIDEIHFRDENNNPLFIIKLYNRNLQVGLSYTIGNTDVD